MTLHSEAESQVHFTVQVIWCIRDRRIDRLTDTAHISNNSQHLCIRCSLKMSQINHYTHQVTPSSSKWIRLTPRVFWLFVCSNWTPIIELLVGICSLLYTQNKLFNVRETTVQQSLQSTTQNYGRQFLDQVAIQQVLLGRLHRMHEMRTTVTDDHDVCQSVHQSVCHVAQLGFTVWCSFGAVFTKSFWPLDSIH